VHRFHARDFPTALVRSGQVDPLDLMDEGIPVRHRGRVTVDLVARTMSRQPVSSASSRAAPSA